MKHKLIIIFFVCFILSTNLVAGYESTEKEETVARTSSASSDDAYLTTRAEQIEALENVDDAKITEMREELDRRGTSLDEAGLTSAAERAAQS